LGVMDKIPILAEVAVRSIRRFEFRTFSVGVTMPEGVQEREDELRSNLQLKGSETIKTQAARLLSAQLSKLLRKSVDKQKPDLTALVDFGADGVLVTSRPVFYYGRYAKPPGVRQHRVLCGHCRGAGCAECRGTGFDQKPSVEEALRKKLDSFCGSERITFTWLGSEDKESRVYPPGRPFVAEIKNPTKRRPPRRFGARLKAGLVTVSSGKVLPSKPTRLPAFKFLTRIRSTAATKVSKEGLSELKETFRNASVRFERPHNRPTVKTVHALTVSSKGRSLLIDAELDGGLPVRRFVSGDLVSPSVSEVLKTEVSCRSFDICKVVEIGEFEFAEVARNQEKN
jgi:tRNA pseudouridine synthase 10